jgi:hypothetical protein
MLLLCRNPRRLVVVVGTANLTQQGQTLNASWVQEFFPHHRKEEEASNLGCCGIDRGNLNRCAGENQHVESEVSKCPAAPAPAPATLGSGSNALPQETTGAQEECHAEANDADILSAARDVNDFGVVLFDFLRRQVGGETWVRKVFHPTLDHFDLGGAPGRGRSSFWRSSGEGKSGSAQGSLCAPEHAHRLDGVQRLLRAALCACTSSSKSRIAASPIRLALFSCGGAFSGFGGWSALARVSVCSKPNVPASSLRDLVALLLPPVAFPALPPPPLALFV